jgi:hypothetical protein
MITSCVIVGPGFLSNLLLKFRYSEVTCLPRLDLGIVGKRLADLRFGQASQRVNSGRGCVVILLSSGVTKINCSLLGLGYRSGAVIPVEGGFIKVKAPVKLPANAFRPAIYRSMFDVMAQPMNTKEMEGRGTRLAVVDILTGRRAW